MLGRRARGQVQGGGADHGGGRVGDDEHDAFLGPGRRVELLALVVGPAGDLELLAAWPELGVGGPDDLAAGCDLFGGAGRADPHAQSGTQRK